MGPLLARLKRRREKLASELAEVDRAIAAIEVPHLHRPSHDANVSTMATMLQTARLHHSQGARKKTGNSNPLAVAADKAGHTVRSLAEQVGCSAALLSQARSGIRSISMQTAKRIEAITGYQATRDNWPLLRTDE